MKSLKVNFALNSANQLLSIIVPLVTTPYLSRILGAESLGIFSYANSVAYYFSMFAMLGLANYGGREIAKSRNDSELLSSVFSGIFTTQLISTGIVTLIYLVYMFVDGGVMSKIYFFSILAVSLDINWLFFGLEEFSVTLKRNFTVKLISTLLIFIFVSQPSDVFCYAIIVVLSTLLGNGVLWISVRGRVKYVKTDFSTVKRHFLSNLTLFLPILLTSIYRVMDKIMLKWMSGYEQVGYYENADKFGQIPLFLVASLSQIMIPRISSLVNENKNTIIGDYFEKSILLISFISTSIIFGISGIADLFVPVYFGRGFEPCVTLIRVIVPSYIFTAYASVIRSQFLIPFSRDKEYAVSLAVGAFLNIILNIILIPWFEAVGAAIATAITEIVVCVMMFSCVRKKIKWKRIVLQNTPFYVSGCIMLFGISILPLSQESWISLLIKIAAGVLIYLAIIGGFYWFYRRAGKGNA